MEINTYVEVFEMSRAEPGRTIVISWSAVEGFCVSNVCQKKVRGGGEQVVGEMGGCIGGREVPPVPPLTGLSSSEVTSGLQSVWDSG